MLVELSQLAGQFVLNNNPQPKLGVIRYNSKPGIYSIVLGDGEVYYSDVIEIPWLLILKYNTAFVLKRFHKFVPSTRHENFHKEDYIKYYQFITIQDILKDFPIALLYFQDTKEIKLYQDNVLRPIILSDILKKHGNVT